MRAEPDKKKLLMVKIGIRLSLGWAELRLSLPPVCWWSHSTAAASMCQPHKVTGNKEEKTVPIKNAVIMGTTGKAYHSCPSPPPQHLFSTQQISLVGIEGRNCNLVMVECIPFPFWYLETFSLIIMFFSDERGTGILWGLGISLLYPKCAVYSLCAVASNPA